MENQKQDKASSQKPDFRSGSRLCVGKVQAPHNVRQKTVPLIKQIKECGFSKYLSFPKKQNTHNNFLNKNKIQIITKQISFFLRKGPTRV